MRVSNLYFVGDVEQWSSTDVDVIQAREPQNRNGEPQVSAE